MQKLGPELMKEQVKRQIQRSRPGAAPIVSVGPTGEFEFNLQPQTQGVTSVAKPAGGVQLEDSISPSIAASVNTTEIKAQDAFDRTLANTGDPDTAQKAYNRVLESESKLFDELSKKSLEEATGASRNIEIGRQFQELAPVARGAGKPWAGALDVMDRAKQLGAEFGLVGEEAVQQATSEMQARDFIERTLDEVAKGKRISGEGQMSDRDVQLLQNMARAGMVDQESIASMGRAMEIAGIRTAAKSKFFDDVKGQMTAPQAQAAWQQYINNNPVGS